MITANSVPCGTGLTGHDPTRASRPRSATLAGERGGALEHADHGLDLTDLPAREVAVERGGAIERTVHGLDLPDLPVRDVAVEVLLVLEQPAHVGNIGRVPRRDGAVLRLRGGRVLEPRPYGRVNAAVALVVTAEGRDDRRKAHHFLKQVDLV